MDERLKRIFAKTDGRCHICGKRLCINNHGKNGRRGAWHIEHSRPRSKGGSDHLNNLLPACIDCNLSKSNSSTRTARRAVGRSRAPLSRAKQNEAREGQAIVGGALGLAAGALLGPVGAIIGAAAGGLVGHGLDLE